jgi:ankyrin repeat protein
MEAQHLSVSISAGLMAAVGEADLHAITSAAGRGDLGDVRRLVQQDRQLLEAYCDQRTPLKVAAEEGRLDVIRYLLDEGARDQPQGRWMGMERP